MAPTIARLVASDCMSLTSREGAVRGRLSYDLIRNFRFAFRKSSAEHTGGNAPTSYQSTLTPLSQSISSSALAIVWPAHFVARRR